MKQKVNIEELFTNIKSNGSYLKVCAPMVRYSKIQFRTLVRRYGVDLCFTPMIMADSFCQNSKARSNEFATTLCDTPLIVQFAANNANDFADATQLVSVYADGVDLNCGCPQRWAMKDGYGCALLNKPQVIYDIVRSVKNIVPSKFSISVKIRLLNDLKSSINMCQQMEHCGVSFLTVHGRTPSQKSGDCINVMGLNTICKSVQIPVIANGGIKSLDDADKLYKEVDCSGIMAASALLTNPALFSGTAQTPIECVKYWMDLKNISKDKIMFQCYHHHLVFMLDKLLTKKEKDVFNRLSTFESVDNFLYSNLVDKEITNIAEIREFVECQFDENITRKHLNKCRGCSKSLYYCACTNKYDPNAVDGNFFTSYIENSECELDYMDHKLFDEI